MRRAFFLCAMFLVGCPEKEGASNTTSASASATVTATASASAPPTASASATATATASATETATPSASAPAPTASAPKPAVDAAVALNCGTKPLPDCPLQAWMKKNTNPPMAASDFPAIATALDTIATFAPAGYPNWASISKDGAKAARASDMTAVKASCRACHDQYKTRYKTELRARAIP